ncbi:hypothetical protein KKD19_01180 [Patescibacteria group bacterium]|nr:hypothetical protein [Patescibacteria group bacterium]MCG2693471.1 hypothetical protein [Candidatus Parcubacteria bacterium]
MEKIVFWGIIFRSSSHMRWFQTTMIILALCIMVFLFYYLIKGRGLYWTWFFGGSTHAWATFMAIIATKFGAVNGSAYSADCIWFNGLMVGIYIGLYHFTKLLTKTRAALNTQSKYQGIKNGSYSLKQKDLT